MSVFHVLVSRPETLGLFFAARLLRLTSTESDALKPGKSNGKAVRRFTRPPIAPSICSAEGFLYTSTPAISSGGTSSKPRFRPWLALKVSRPLSCAAT